MQDVIDVYVRSIRSASAMTKPAAVLLEWITAQLVERLRSEGLMVGPMHNRQIVNWSFILAELRARPRRVPDSHTLREAWVTTVTQTPILAVDPMEDLETNFDPSPWGWEGVDPATMRTYITGLAQWVSTHLIIDKGFSPALRRNSVVLETVDWLIAIGYLIDLETVGGACLTSDIASDLTTTCVALEVWYLAVWKQQQEDSKAGISVNTGALPAYMIVIHAARGLGLDLKTVAGVCVALSEEHHGAEFLLHLHLGGQLDGGMLTALASIDFATVPRELPVLIRGTEAWLANDREGQLKDAILRST